ncbi:MAG TPA: tetratricopeptide repeat protein, partial [Solirubrobacterales bacterium]|nr:tetratricopeptide repeat protein [Solirubrobacterales bacterium]
DHARALRTLGRFEESLAALEAADGDHPDLHESIGATLGYLGRAEESLEHLNRAAEASDSYAPVHNLRADALRELGRYRDAEVAARRAVELDDQEPTFHFTLTEILLDGGDTRAGIETLEVALAAWRTAKTVPPGETDLLCRIVWQRFDGSQRTEVVARIVRAYKEVGAVTALGRGLVATIPLVLDQNVGEARADSWVADWTIPGTEELEVPVEMLAAATAWKRDRDRAHLLALPPEQREIVLGMLPR